MKSQILPAIKAFAILAIITGVAYPLLITGIAQLAFNGNANGSIIYQNGKAVGSKLIGQEFTDAKYFWSRPSAVSYSSSLSGASNLGPTSAKLDSTVNARRQSFASANEVKANTPIPADMLCSSASGLDPHISLESAMLQLNRVAKARGFDAEKREKVVHLIYQKSHTIDFATNEMRYVNVLELNLEINKL
ncbi:potassium-transporting ATPase subunit KdpC [Alistipes sp. ZOR0009]|uniref:potassium-transporting ATPase subunit KdpC n=1 Tax=Alistipes sp. ZOR0009 TaxID=1339253 RepID=UPI0006459B54|nr:potassium-transporting ATPase subunit KdpC [Alistipes sp. ZOR0009]